MSYKISEKSKEQTILLRESIYLKVLLLTIFGSVFLATGILLAVLLYRSENDFEKIKFTFLFSGAGLLIILLAISLPQSHKKRVPEKITFDNRTGLIKIIQDTKKMNSPTAYIKYNEVDRLDIKTETHTSNDSEGHSNTYYTYHAILIKKDGGEIELYDSRLHKPVENFIQSLTEHINFQQPVKSEITSTFPTSIQKSDGMNKSTVRWENNALSGVLPLLLVGAYISYFFYVIFSSIKDVPVIVYVILSIIATLFFAFFVIYLWRIVKATTTIYGFSISRDLFEYFEEDKNGSIKTSTKVPLNELYSITFQLKVSGNNDSVMLFTKDQHSKISAFKNDEVTFTNLKNAFSAYKEQISLNTKGLTTVEKIQLEYWIQDVIKEKSSLDVL